MLKTIPDHTAVRVALWRAMHVLVDAAPHVFVDEIGLKMAAPDSHWRERGDMHPQGTRGYRASIVGRARFIEEQINTKQYVILGAGLDSFAQRRSDVDVYEIDEPQTQAWKRQRLLELGYDIPQHLHFVPVNFETGESWLTKLQECGFKMERPALVASAGVSMYLTREANQETLKKVAALAAGSTFIMTFMLPPELVAPEDRVAYETVMKRTAEAGTPFLSLFSPAEALALAREVGLKDVKHVSHADIIARYFATRPDGLRPSSGEEFLVVTV